MCGAFSLYSVFHVKDDKMRKKIWPPIKLNSKGSELKKILNRPVWAVWQKQAIVKPNFWTKGDIFFGRAWELKMVILQKII